jgi:hypothetical protein
MIATTIGNGAGVAESVPRAPTTAIRLGRQVRVELVPGDASGQEAIDHGHHRTARASFTAT